MDDPEVKITIEETDEFIWKVITIPARIVMGLWGVIWPRDEPPTRR